MIPGRTALVCALVALAWCSLTTSVAAQAHRHESGALVDVVSRAIQQFANPGAAVAAGYGPFLGCVSGPQEGAMGIHDVNGDLVGDGELDAEHPEALMYEPRNGRLILVGVEFIVLADQCLCRDAPASRLPVHRRRRVGGRQCATA